MIYFVAPTSDKNTDAFVDGYLQKQWLTYSYEQRVVRCFKFLVGQKYAWLMNWNWACSMAPTVTRCLKSTHFNFSINDDDDDEDNILE